MTDHIIKAARDCGMTTGDNQKHDGEYWWRSLGRPTNVRTSDLARFYAIAYRAGMERAAEICDRLQDVPATEPRHCAEDIRIEAASIGTNKEGA